MTSHSIIIATAQSQALVRGTPLAVADVLATNRRQPVQKRLSPVLRRSPILGGVRYTKYPRLPLLDIATPFRGTSA
jgi:hypothetical protein